MSVTLVSDIGGKRLVVQLSPNSTLYSALEQFCSKFKEFSPERCQLLVNNREIDPSLTFRLSGLTSAQKITVKAKSSQQSQQTESTVLVVVQLPNGERLQNYFSSATKLWTIITSWLEGEKKLNLTQDPSIQITLTFMQTEVKTNEDLQLKTLKDIGLISGNGLLRLNLRKNGNPVELNTTHLIKENNQNTIQNNPSSETNSNVNMQSSEQKQMETNETISITTTNGTNSTEAATTTTTTTTTESTTTIHRKLKIFFPKTEKIEDIPEEGLEPTANELMQFMASRQRSLEESTILKTKEMREREKQQSMSKFQLTRIRIRFPDLLVFEGSFASQEKISALYSFVKQQLNSDATFQLFITPPMTKLKETQSLKEVDLVPSGLVHLKWLSGADSNVSTVSLLSEDSNQLFSIEQQNQTAKPEKEVEMEDEKTQKTQNSASSTKKTSSDPKKVPAWFKKGKK